jgi:hypothetical protein
MNVKELIRQLEEIARMRPDAKVSIYKPGFCNGQYDGMYPYNIDDILWTGEEIIIS